MTLPNRSPWARSRFMRIVVVVLVFVAAGGGAARSSASQATPASPTSVSPATPAAPSVDPGQISANCLKQDDVACVVAVWTHQFALKPHDAQTRQSLVDAYLLACFRSLDKGDLPGARAALTHAKAVIPSSPLYAYYQDALDAYQSVLFQDDAEIKGEFVVADTSYAGLQYPEMPGVFGAPTTVCEITEQTPGVLDVFPVWGLPQSAASTNAALRFEAFPMDANGSIYAIFGGQNDGSYFAAQVLWLGGSSARVALYHRDSAGWTIIGTPQYVAAAPNQWHQIEVRISGQSVQTWIDTALVDQQIVLDYRPGEFGLGVGLGQVEKGVTFSAAFYDFALYQLVG